MRGARRIAIGTSALLVGMLGAPAAHAAKPPPPPPKTVEFQLASTSVTEGDQNFAVALTRSVTKGKAKVTVRASIAGGDTAEPEDIPTAIATATFASGSGVAQAVLPLPDDNEYEGDETFTVSIASAPKGFVATDTISVQILEDDPAPPAPHAGTFTVPPGNVASFSNVNLNSCNDLTLVVVGSDGSSLEIASNTSGDECPGPVTPVVTETVANNTLDPITLHVDLEDDSCGATYGSDHTGAGNASGADHALTTEVDSTSFEVDLLDGGAGCGRVADEAIPQVNDGDAQVDISISPSVLATGIWIVPDGWTARFDQFFVSGCDNGTKGHLVVDGVDTYTQECFSNTPPSTLVNTSGATKLVQFVLEDVTCGVRYSTSHTSDGATSVDHAMIWDVGSGNYQVAITNAGASCENEDVNSVPGIGGGDFVPFIAVYQSPCC